MLAIGPKNPAEAVATKSSLGLLNSVEASVHEVGYVSVVNDATGSGFTYYKLSAAHAAAIGTT